MPDPLVSVIIVNFNGRAFLPELFESLRAQSFSDHEVIMVDNASTDGSAALVRDRFPEVRILEPGMNLGFSRANNLGFAAARGEYFALLNNDTTVDADWLAALVAEIHAGPRIGAVAPKILFARPFLEVTLVSDVHRPSDLGSPDGRQLGVFVDASSRFTNTTYRKPIFRAGFHSPETILGASGRWTSERASLLLPVENRHEAARLRLRVFAGPNVPTKRVGVCIGGQAAWEVSAGATFTEHDLDVPRRLVSESATEVVNNAGSDLGADGRASDRGIFQPDRGQYDSATDVTAICGCSALLSRAALDVAGMFDEDFFMYFEDTELSWRLRKAGFQLRYQPASVVHHHHAAASGEYSRLFNYHVTRNRILMLIRHAPLPVAARALADEMGRTLLLWRSHRAATPGDQRARLSENLRIRLAVQKSLLRQVPRFLRKRWSRSARTPAPTMGSGTGLEIDSVD